MFLIQIILAVSVIWFEVSRTRHVKIDIMSMFSLLYFICFVIAPISGYYISKDVYNIESYSVFFNTIGGKMYDFSAVEFYVTGLLTLASYWVVIAVFSLYRPKTTRFTLLDRVFTSQLNKKTLYIIGVICLFTSLLVLFYIQMTQGITTWLLSNPRAYMSSERDGLQVESLSWTMDKLLRLGVFSSLVFWGLEMSQTKVKRLSLLRILFIISFILSCIIIYRIAGRLVFFRYFAVFFLAYILVKKPKHIYLKSFILLSFGVLFIIYGRLLFRYFLYTDHVTSTLLNLNDSTLQSYFKFISNFTFPFFSASKNLSHLNEGFYWFRDLFLLPFSFVSSNLTGVLYISSSEINTYRVWNVKGEMGNPSDMISYGLINAGYAGVMVVSAGLGFVLKKMNSYITKLKSPVSAILFVYLGFTVVFFVMYCDPQHFFKGSMEYWIGLMAVFFSSKFNYRQK